MFSLGSRSTGVPGGVEDVVAALDLGTNSRWDSRHFAEAPGVDPPCRARDAAPPDLGAALQLVFHLEDAQVGFRSEDVDPIAPEPVGVSVPLLLARARVELDRSRFAGDHHGARGRLGRWRGRRAGRGPPGATGRREEKTGELPRRIHAVTSCDIPGRSSTLRNPCRLQPNASSQVRGATTGGDSPGDGGGSLQPSNHAAEEHGS